MLIAPALSVADVGPGYAECALMANVIQPAAGVASTKAAALESLERIVEGRLSEIRPESEKQLGLDPGQLRHPAFSVSAARVCAARSLGRTGLPEAVDFLQGLKETEAPDDRSRMVWSAAQIAIREASLVHISEPDARWKFLEGVVEERGVPGQVAYWAMEELCNSGDVEALPRIRAILTRLYNGDRDRGEEEVNYCESRMQVVARNPDRAKALGTVFSSVTQLDSTEPGRRLLAWAMCQLAALHSPSADAELERLAKDLATLHKAFPDDVKLSMLADDMSAINATRKR
jgi:hypothetical protein